MTLILIALGGYPYTSAQPADDTLCGTVSTNRFFLHGTKVLQHDQFAAIHYSIPPKFLTVQWGQIEPRSRSVWSEDRLRNVRRTEPDRSVTELLSSQTKLGIRSYVEVKRHYGVSSSFHVWAAS